VGLLDPKVVRRENDAGEVSSNLDLSLLWPVAVLSLLSLTRPVPGLATMHSLPSIPDPRLSVPRDSLVKIQRTL
jgi:hypothetical protein